VEGCRSDSLIPNFFPGYILEMLRVDISDSEVHSGCPLEHKPIRFPTQGRRFSIVSLVDNSSEVLIHQVLLTARGPDFLYIQPVPYLTPGAFKQEIIIFIGDIRKATGRGRVMGNHSLIEKARWWLWLGYSPSLCFLQLTDAPH